MERLDARRVADIVRCSVVNMTKMTKMAGDTVAQGSEATGGQNGQTGQNGQDTTSFIDSVKGFASKNPEIAGAGIGALLAGALSQTMSPVGEVERSDRFWRLKNLLMLATAGGGIGAMAGHYHKPVYDFLSKVKTRSV